MEESETAAAVGFETAAAVGDAVEFKPSPAATTAVVSADAVCCNIDEGLSISEETPLIRMIMGAWSSLSHSVTMRKRDDETAG